ncbi:MAG: DivIVA domain-containing protein [Ruminococcaceae bacterium]|nr:DivIVA domain-containing protein [Oscillospiraceae bacterium]
MTSQEIRTVTFEQTKKGYRQEDVDDFLSKVAGDIDALTAARDAALAEKAAAEAAREDAESKMYILAEKAEEYRGQEDILKTALINAQRMGETVVHEAKQKADQMLREATGQAELLRQRAEAEINRERQTLDNLVAEVARFKSTVLNLYKQHIESMSALDPPLNHAEQVLEENAPRTDVDEIDVDEELAMIDEPEPVIIPHMVPQQEEDNDEALLHAEVAMETAAEEETIKEKPALFSGQLLDE